MSIINKNEVLTVMSQTLSSKYAPIYIGGIALSAISLAYMIIENGYSLEWNGLKLYPTATFNKGFHKSISATKKKEAEEPIS